MDHSVWSWRARGVQRRDRRAPIDMRISARRDVDGRFVSVTTSVTSSALATG